MYGNKSTWQTAGTALALAAWLGRLFGWFDRKVTAWLSFGSAACALMATR
jgi:hypothetical protein